MKQQSLFDDGLKWSPARPLKVLVACEYSGAVRDAFLALGHDAVSCDILPTESPGPHLQCDVLEVLDRGFDLMVAHPPCTFLCSSGLHWNKKRPERAAKTQAAVEFVLALWRAPIERIVIENPVGCLPHYIGKAAQWVQPHEFGHDASKKTGLWLKGLEPLAPTELVAGRLVNGRERWSNQTDSGQNKLSPSPDRWKLRSTTYSGIAKAMAEQWGGQCL